MLEEFSQFLAPLRLPITLGRTKQCETVNASTTRPIPGSCSATNTSQHRGHRAEGTTPEGITREDAIIGQIVGVLLHEGGHAVSNLLRLPVLGREEDTADQSRLCHAAVRPRHRAHPDQGRGIRLAPRRAPVALQGTHSTACSASKCIFASPTAATPKGSRISSSSSAGCRRSAPTTAPTNTSRPSTRSATTIVPHLDMDLVKQMREKPLTFPMPGDGK